jgi:hypothetical protein
MNGTKLNVCGTGGIGYGKYYVLTASNLKGPWSPMATNQFDAAGNFIFTNQLNPNLPAAFFRLQEP